MLEKLKEEIDSFEKDLREAIDSFEKFTSLYEEREDEPSGISLRSIVNKLNNKVAELKNGL